MDVVSHCAFPVAGRVWKPRPGAHVFTFVCKATFALAPGKLALAAEQQPIHEVDRPWSESIKSLYAAADTAPRKLRPDVVLIGNACAPGGVPAPKVVARLVVGDVDKSVEVWCDRTLRPDGSVVEGPPFTTLPLLYERAAGGPGTDNPVGIPFEPDPYGSILLPNLTPPGARISRDAPIKPTGFGPIGARWPTRLSRLGRHADSITPETWHEQPLPPDVDLTYFNVAPADQQPTQLRADERIVLENLHREHSQLTMSLPGIRLRAKVSGPGGERSATVACDTLWIDTSRGICCLTYRGQVLLGGASEAGWVVVTVDTAEVDETASLTGTIGDDGDPPTPPPQRVVAPVPPPPPPRPRPANPTLPFLATGAEPVEIGRPRGLPFQAPADSLRRADTAVPFQPPPGERRRDAVPFQPAGEPRRPDAAIPFRRDVPPPAPSSPVGNTPPGGLPFQVSPPSLTMGGPIGDAPATPARPAVIAGPPVAPPAVVAAPPPPAPVFSAPVSAPSSDSPWAISGGPGPGTIAPVTAGPVAAAPAPGDFRSGGGALLASNAAAGVNEARPAAGPAPAPRPVSAASIVARPAPKEPQDTLDLVFFEAEAMPRIRRVPAWKKLLAELDDRPLDPEEDDPAEAKEPAAVEDRREIFEILLRATPSDAPALDEALARAARDDGRFFPPLLVVTGEISTPFDEIEMLKATVTTVSPLAGNDENLRASIEVAKDFLKLPGLSSSPQVAEGLTGRVRDAFAGAKRQVPANYLDAQTERALVDQRHYQHRKVLGGRRQRALFHFAGGSGNGAPLVTYLPESAGQKLPLFARFKARLVARVHLPLDQYEQGPALEALALGRLCSPPKRAEGQK